jgi:hypothetical protein
MNDLSSFLFARPGFTEGCARILDFGSTLNEYNRSLNGAQADQLALWADWTLSCRSLHDAIKAALRVKEVETD